MISILVNFVTTNDFNLYYNNDNYKSKFDYFKKELYMKNEFTEFNQIGDFMLTTQKLLNGNNIN